MTARENITRALRHAGLLDLVHITAEAEDRIYARTDFDAAFLKALGWTHDPDCVAKLLHEGAVESYREPNAVMPALQITFLKNGKADIDLDLANPEGGDVASSVVHAAEFLWHWISRTKSDQQRVARWLDRRFGPEPSSIAASASSSDTAEPAISSVHPKSG